MSNRNPIRRSMARVEFLSCMAEIESMLSQGFSKQLIYERLKGEGRISMAYVTFAKLIAMSAKDELKVASLHPVGKPAPVPKPKPSVLPPAQPKIIKADSDTLQDPRTVDPSTLF